MDKLKKKIEKSSLYIIEKLGPFFNPLILNFTNEKNRLLIFYFHGVYRSQKEKELNHVDPQNNLLVSQFEEFIEYFLLHKYHFLKPNDLLNDLPCDKPCIMITFDDGYFNNTLAIDLLNKYKIPATFFITANNVLENKSYWWDIVYKFRVKQGMMSLSAIRKEQAHLKNFKSSFIENYIKQNFGDKSHVPWSDVDRPLNTSELKSISKNPFVTIGNHTYNHTILTNYSLEEIKEELRLCNKFVFETTGSSPNTIAFPNGNFNETVLNIAKEAGFQFAFTIENKINRLPVSISRSNPITCLSRFMALPMEVPKYAALNRLGYSPFSLYENLKKRMRFI